MSVNKEVKYSFRECTNAYAYKDYTDEKKTSFSFSFKGDSENECVEVTMSIGEYDSRNLMKALATRLGYECAEKVEEKDA